MIVRELEQFAGAGDDTAVALADKPRIAAANKIDALDEPERLKKLERHLKKLKVPLYRISAATGEGLPELLEAMWKQVAVTDGAAGRVIRCGLLGGTFDPIHLGHLDVAEAARRALGLERVLARPGPDSAAQRGAARLGGPPLRDGDAGRREPPRARGIGH